MKRLYLLFVLIAFCFQINAQENYRPFVEEGKEWKYYIKATTSWWDGKESHWDTEYAYSALTINGDTLVDGKKYKKIMHNSDKNIFYFIEASDFLYGIIREEDKKVYMRTCFSSFVYDGIFDHEMLIYDFGLKVGDTFRESYAGFSSYDKIMKLESIENTDNERVFSFSLPGEDLHTMKWIEGVGGFHGLGLIQLIPESTCIDCTRYSFLSLSCTLGDEVLCSFDEDGNVVLGVEEVKTDVNKDKSIYDLQGRRLSAEPERGLYIKDGKKIAR